MADCDCRSCRKLSFESSKLCRAILKNSCRSLHCPLRCRFTAGVVTRHTGSGRHYFLIADRPLIQCPRHVTQPLVPRLA